MRSLVSERSTTASRATVPGTVRDAVVSSRSLPGQLDPNALGRIYDLWPLRNRSQGIQALKGGKLTGLPSHFMEAQPQRVEAIKFR